MSVLASGALPPQEAVEYVCQFPHIESIVFGRFRVGGILRRPSS